MVRLTDEDLKAIRERVEKATPGEWITDVCYADNGGRYIAVCTSHRATEVLGEHGPGEDDAKFIAAAKSDVPRLLDEVERLKAKLAEAERMSDALAKAYRNLLSTRLPPRTPPNRHRCS